MGLHPVAGTATTAAAHAPTPDHAAAPRKPAAKGSSPRASQAAALRLAPLPRRRCVLVSKQLTNSDASSGRIILPRVAVESNLSFVLGYRHYALAVKDCYGRQYEFMIKSWANGTEHRRVFVLEQAGAFLKAHGVGVGDAVGICSDENGDLVVEANSEEVRQATVTPKYGGAALAAPPPGSTAAVPLVEGARGRCIRSPDCTKAAGHPGFCSGPKAAAAAAARQQAAASRAAAQPGASEGSARGGAAASNSSGEEAATRLGTPRGRAAAASTAECGAAALAALPAGLHPIAHIPSGLRLTKVLTAYDLTSRRVVMPVPAVEAGVGAAPTTDRLTLAAVDESARWHFPTLLAWTNVAGRRGYLLEGLAGMLANRSAREGDTLLFFRDADSQPPRIELRAAGAAPGAPPRRPAAPEPSAPPFASLPLLLHPKGEGPAAASGPAAAGGRGLLPLHTKRRAAAGASVCRRTTTCTKAAGHQGFCSGHKGFKRRDSPTASSAYGARRPFARYRDWVEEDDEYLTSDDDSSFTAAARPKRPRRASAAAVAATVAAAASREGSPLPHGGRAPHASDPLLSLLSVLDCMETGEAAAAAASGAASAAVQAAVMTAEAAATAAYGAAKCELVAA
ncbi:hypothetical protein CHLNCDRAFT_142158 [Chlorella variabilis]|uniref:TF-B3 domain-containing protein n=1 Tax=Chlorella variabilis TaxID=554065 RepID=E1Z7X0_CHLVA|nr:hypothetical protein CHLNCDRAFT_142158 [Chlorella variabilis]EFN57994.1 hypothetical protein CHLNCDRAFT_142158 [Chlorella variabilis]|eukprot:XP_005850096.1 hypothetical protein CHLNCDRAFT_142158 [Chlorella variabilis]